ncbi:threonine--tRNA ligase [Phocea massiliensis]|uniref:Threonine--tRNA ligase n=1 Tax=uncultured Anaerotruncus sp. TaxID=905011 RepID=A0A6N2TDW6_9FIRM|nr:threonine--tRNA ligase [Merdimmobilis hominis]MCD4835804.1 threonine--tRNA ligase [Merdimmobilis hominis]
MINITLKDGVAKEYQAPITPIEIAKDLSAGLAKAACAAKVNGELRDLRFPIESDANVSILTFEDAEGKKAFWHTSAHVLAQAVQHLYPEAKLTIGPAVDNGFYYDIDVEKPFVAEDLEKIEAEMKKIVKEGEALERFELSGDEAKELMKDNPYKVELIEEHAGKGEKLSFFRQGDFTDLCAGPHLMNTSPIKAIKLTQCTGAYWRGDANNRMLCRVYGISFPKASMLEEHLKMLEEAKKRDHRKLGKELELFDIFEEGPGFPVFLPKGMALRNTLEGYWRELHRKAGYLEIRTPLILNEELWHRSGHWDHYKDNMYTTVIDGEDYAVKPMNCPGGMLVYKSKPRSYRDLPLRMGELGIVHRHELSGALHGLMRVRCFTQDDAHIFMTEDMIKDEIKGVAALIDEVYSMFGFKYHVELSTMPEDHMGSLEQWEQATSALENALKELGRDYVINEGDGAFYGPKIDFHLEDCLGRTWQCGTIQLDYQMPERFDLEYTGADGEKHRPIMIHRVLFGSIERFIGILTEHFAGAFPMWLAPVQVKVIPVSEKHMDYAKGVYQKLFDAGLRVELDERNEKIGYKIREAQLEKVPYMLIVGDKEEEAGNVSVRSRSDGDKGVSTLEDFLCAIKVEIDSKAQ